ncbi:MAG: isoamylase early set domain-containing protein [Spirochaetales bacterium]|nr:isoamylase early set domain-containing protein [Spirochaetales bacterium]
MSIQRQYLRWVVPAASGMIFLMIMAFVVVMLGIPAATDDAVLTRFSLDAPDAESVALVGDFNKWDIKSHLMYKEENIWVIDVRLKKGTYSYKFVIDGEKWITDPAQVATVDDVFGGKNTVIEIY